MSTTKKQRLRALVEELIALTGWPDDKQRIWLAKQGVESWSQCSESTLKRAIEKLALSATTFGKRIDTSIAFVQDDCGGDDEATGGGLRIFDDGGE